MAQPSRSGKLWTKEEIQTLKNLVKQNTPTRVIALKIHRTPEAVQSKARDEKISLAPRNQKPNNRSKK
jgi:hypothetical protein